MRLLVVFCVLIVAVFGRKGFGPTDQEWGFVTVREDAHMFWWLHYTNATTKATDKPLIIWLQGGPGASSTQYGNFEELGPLDLNLNPRNSTWVNYANVLFVDNPVGTGFSYVENDAYATNNTQIAKDFVALLQGFYKDLPQFEDVPLYIFCESYGGKMTAEIALYLDQAIKAGSIKSNFKGVGLGDSWISPIDSCLSWAPYLLNLGFIDTKQYNQLTTEGLSLQDLIDHGRWTEATDAWSYLESSVASYTYDVDFYNVLTLEYDPFWDRNPLNKPRHRKNLNEKDLMVQVQEALNITNAWGLQSQQVLSFLSTDFMKPVTNIVERLLNETDLKVAVYNGQLDLIVDTPGTLHWVERLNYTGSEEWSTANREYFSVNYIIEGYEKKAGNLEFYWVLRSGHMVPLDNPNGMYYILQQVTDNFKV